MKRFIKIIRNLEGQYNWGQFCLGTKTFGFRYDVQDECDYPPMFTIQIPFIFSIYYRLKRRKPETNDFRQKNISYGFYYFDDNLVLCLGEKKKYIEMPWALQWRSTELLDFDRKTIFKETPKDRGKFDEFYRLKQNLVKPYPFQYILKNGEIQNRVAKICIERRIWSMNWFRWIKKISTTISIEFNGEVGEETGSWKGGCTGCSYDLLDNETPEQSLRRLENEKNYFGR